MSLSLLLAFCVLSFDFSFYLNSPATDVINGERKTNNSISRLVVPVWKIQLMLRKANSVLHWNSLDIYAWIIIGHADLKEQVALKFMQFCFFLMIFLFFFTAYSL